MFQDAESNPDGCSLDITLLHSISDRSSEMLAFVHYPVNAMRNIARLQASYYTMSGLAEVMIYFVLNMLNWTKWLCCAHSPNGRKMFSTRQEKGKNKLAETNDANCVASIVLFIIIYHHQVWHASEF